MTQKERLKRMAHAEEMFLYNLESYETAKAKGSLASAERALNDSAEWAAIYSALRLMGMGPLP